jgi:prevent-host-death family protein
MTVNVHKAKTNLSRLLKKVAAGEEVTIARAGTPVAQLVPVKPKGAVPLGFDRGRVWVSDDFDDPLPPDLLAQFYGETKKKRKPKR